ncbi:MAG: hypothetical protein B7W95_00740 [Acidimicrobiales bacterium 20-64-4]|nr:MAG: hypothetical protein B7W95_00740 [Acidimicrobiales bacterium 20-64-4]
MTTSGVHLPSRRLNVRATLSSDTPPALRSTDPAGFVVGEIGSTGLESSATSARSVTRTVAGTSRRGARVPGAVVEVVATGATGTIKGVIPVGVLPARGTRRPRVISRVAVVGASRRRSRRARGRTELGSRTARLGSTRSTVPTVRPRTR